MFISITCAHPPGAPPRLWRQRGCSVFLSTNWVTISDGRTSHCALLRRRASTSYLTFTESIRWQTDSLWAPAGRLALTWTPPACTPHRRRCGSSCPHLYATFPPSTGFKAPESLHRLWNKATPAADKVLHEVRALRCCRCSGAPIFITPDMQTEVLQMLLCFECRRSEINCWRSWKVFWHFRCVFLCITYLFF